MSLKEHAVLEDDVSLEPRTMVRTRNAVERKKVADVESAQFNPDVVFLLVALLDARDLCQVSLTCKALADLATLSTCNVEIGVVRPVQINATRVSKNSYYFYSGSTSAVCLISPR